ncbi:Zn(II)2Cys6 transcription factor [Aspergillus puulaauensis]|uniref:Zn(2)-C6 fungal-type domain-containing protein n=1 Tax=Aspergillus puulaauensis TaxID=1220207 RepID=A0A7R8AKV8_9EURO|nr:uncharacterized protein APUU_21517S [Aspergillus puulaauensis]BCS21085.1 hypothetical protein APUU_21517S [Aspergillus puulaauensis]
MPTQRPARRSVKRRKTGHQNCRNRRIKCDEQSPCGYCNRRGLECKKADFIVPERWGNTPEPTRAGEESQPATRGTAPSSQRQTTPEGDPHIPESTYEIFQHVFSVDNDHLPTSDLRSTITSDNILTEEKAGLLRFYQEGIGVWMDIFDHSHTYQNDIVRYSLSSPLLMHAVCALSANQMSLIQNKYLWGPVSSRFYGQSLSLLINELTKQSSRADGELLLAATILLGSYELLAQPGIDYQRHLYGAQTLIFSRNIGQQGTSLEKASFWIFARQDVALALVNERPTLVPPVKWPVPPESPPAAVEDAFGMRILWLLARVVEVKFGSPNGGVSNIQRERVESLVAEIDLAWAGLPSHVRGVPMKQSHSEDEGLTRVWFCVPSASAACLYYHMAKILTYEFLLEQTRLPSRQSDDMLRSIGHHARAIASICLFSDLADGALVVAVNPIFYAAKYIPSMALKTRLWGILDRIETRLGFYTRDRQTQLQLELKK